MRHARLASLIIGAGAFIAIAFILRGRTTDSSGGDARLPLNPFVGAEKGDWAILIATSREGTHRAEAEVFLAQVADRSGTDVTTRLDSRTRKGEIIEGGPRVFSSVDSPRLAAFFTPAGARYELSNASMEPSTREAFGRRIPCTKVELDRRDLAEPGASTVHVTAWLSAEVRGCGLLHAVAEGRDPHGCATTVTFELLGFGHGERATLGKTPAEVPFDNKPVLLPAH